MIRGLLMFFGACLFFVSSAESKVTEQEMVDAVKAEFAEQGISGDLEVELFGGQTSFETGNAKQTKILISDLQAVDGQNKFTAEAAIFADGKSVGQTKLFGRYFVTTEVWLPVKDIAKDALIAEDDLYLGRIRSNRLRKDMAVAKEELVGKQVVRQIKADKPIVEKDIRDEVIIKKGDAITAVYTHKGLQITSKTEALENGAKGQSIRLLNVKSGKEIMGRVWDKNTVEIVAE